MPPQTLSEQEKVQIRHHCGYLNVSAGQTFALGFPAAVETQFIIEGAMNLVNPAALPLVRRILGICDMVEQQKVDDLELLAVERLDTIDINQEEQEGLDKQYAYWVNALCNALGVQRNTFDQRTFNKPGGINARVSG